MLDRPGVIGRVKRSFPLLRALDFRGLKLFLGVDGGTGPPPARFAVVEPKRHHNAPHSRTAALVYPGQCTEGAIPATPDNSERAPHSERGAVSARANRSRELDESPQESCPGFLSLCSSYSNRLRFGCQGMGYRKRRKPDGMSLSGDGYRRFSLMATV
jgi:hypothetical protein